MSGPSHGGKGDSPRPYSKKNWDNSWDRIFNKNKMTSYALFLDDVREVKDAWLHDEEIYLTEASGIPRGSWDIVRSYDDFKKYILERGVPKVISWDFDLNRGHMQYYIHHFNAGTWDIDDLEYTGYHCLKWLINHCKEIGAGFPQSYVHSANQWGRALITKTIQEYENQS